MGALPAAGGGGGAQAAGVDAAVLAAAKQRAERLREALDEERQRGVELEQTLQLQVQETSRAADKAERRKQRLAALEHEHKLATARLESDKSRLEERVRWLEDEAAARAKSLQGLRMEVAKLRSDLGDKDAAVMRARREAANCRARLGAAPPTAAELLELAGDDKASWAQVYSITVEERNGAQEEVRRLQEAVARGRLEADTRVAAERLAGEERTKERDAELDRRRREVMQLEYKVHELQAQLADAQQQQLQRQGSSSSQSLTPVLAPPLQPHQQQQPLQHKLPLPQQQLLQAARGRPAVAFPPFAAPRPRHPIAEHPGKPQAAARSSGPGTSTTGAPGWQQPRPQAAGPSATGAAVAAASDGDHRQAPTCGLTTGGAAELRLGGEVEAEMLLAQMEAQEGRVQAGGAVAGSGAGVADISDDDDGDGALATLADFCGEEAGGQQLEEEELDEGGGRGPRLAADALVGGEDDAPILIDDVCDGDPVPALPRVVCGLFAGDRSIATGSAGSGGGGGKAGSGLAAGKGGLATGAVPSFAKRLISEGPDGRGGTTRFPLTSSYALNQQLPSKSSGGKGGKGGGKGSGVAAAGRPGSGAAGRIDAFLKRVPGPGPR
ncbi:hypothetical protein HYH02_000601 [Chlamydomonas schloesseri]|uniref:Uncharacterized protein n=1 Tax=Chlamydomonas schloesseri TaxID=2026947 RepID=A0A835WW52_9CHLO|nr:hypothetical protein HYH02_000601 [Chlamydomonas schloesseri]|eukprot:KAG2454766.1 hypothetical protein HYH02_000601 [Chlamydomonas schloesseri]